MADENNKAANDNTTVSTPKRARIALNKLAVAVVLVAALLFGGGLWALSGPLAHSGLFATTTTASEQPEVQGKQAANQSKKDREAAGVSSTQSSAEPPEKDSNTAPSKDRASEKSAVQGSEQSNAEISTAALATADETSPDVLDNQPYEQNVELSPQAVETLPEYMQVTPDAHALQTSNQPDNPQANTSTQAQQPQTQTSQQSTQPSSQPTQPQAPVQAPSQASSQPPVSESISANPVESEPPQAIGVTVSLTIDATPVGMPPSSVVVTLEQGASVYDALIASGANVNARNTGYGVYVAAINGVAERDFGAQSGWMYAVNGVYPNTACSNYVLSDGETISWVYVNAEV